jgi:CBS domain-containing protein
VDVDIRSSITESVLTIGPQHTLREAARAMAERNIGSAIVVMEDGRPAILTERDVLRAVAAEVDLDGTAVEERMTSEPTTASPSWDVIKAADAMIRGRFRHLIVLDDSGSVAGVLSIRDLIAGLLAELKTES